MRRPVVGADDAGDRATLREPLPCAVTANNNSVYIGSWNGSSEFFRGTIDEVAVYGTALTATQVSNHRIAGVDA